MDSSKFYSTPLFYLKLIGLQVEYEKTFSGRLLKYYGYFGIVALIVFITFAVHFIVENIKSVMIFTDSIGPCCSSIFIVSKLTNFLIQKKRIGKLIKELQMMSDSVSEEEFKLLEEAAVTGKRMTKIFYYSNLFTGVTFYIKNLVINLTSHRTFFVPLSFFFDVYKSPIYELVFLVSLQANNGLIFGFSGFDGLFYALGCSIAGHFKILQNRIRNLQFYDSVEKNYQEFGKLIVYQNNIFKCCSELRNTYAVALISMFMFSCTMMCFLGFQVVTNEVVVVKVNLSIYLACVTIQLLFYDIIGSLLVTESLNTAKAVYDCNWKSAPPSSRRSIAMMMMRSQKPYVLKVMFFETSLECFTDVMNVAASYITCLKSYL